MALLLRLDFVPLCWSVGRGAGAEIPALSPHPAAEQIGTKSTRRSRATAISDDIAEKEPLKVIAAEKKASSEREKSRSNLAKRQAMPSSKPDPHGSQARPNVFSTVAPVSVSPNDAQDISMGSPDVQCFSDFHRKSNAFSTNLTAEKSVHFSN